MITDSMALCNSCPWRPLCGGWSAGSCSLSLDGSCSVCADCCVHDPDRFSRMVNEVRGLQLSDVKAQPQSIPVIPRRVVKFRDGDLYGRGWPADPVIATTLDSIIKRQHATRQRNRMSPTSLLTLDGCCRDRVLEDLWRRRGRFSLYDRIQKEEPCVLIAPDMSVYVDMPACHKLYQIKRTFLMYAHYQRHGLYAIPFLAPDNEAHALHLASWLRANKCVTHVAASFQTLQRRRDVWRRHMQLLERIRDEILPRRLVWVLIGQKPQSVLDSRLGHVCYIVAGPKFKIMRRLRADRQIPWSF